MGGFFEPGDGGSFAIGEWAPRLDLSESKDALIVKVEVRGGADLSVTAAHATPEGAWPPSASRADC